MVSQCVGVVRQCVGGGEGELVVAKEKREDSGYAPIDGTLPFSD